MASETISAGIECLVSRNAHYEAVSKALNLFVGRGKRYSYKAAERGSGVPERMIEAYRYPPDNEYWRPIKPEELASLFSFFGPDFTTEYLAAVAGQGAYWLPDADEPDPARMSADSAEDTATIARAAADGKFDQDERQQLRVVGQRKIERGQQLVALAAPSLKAVA